MKPKLVESGRGVYIKSGKYAGRFAVIINAIDHRAVLIEGPTTGVPRHATHLNLLKLTSVRIKINHTANSKSVAQVLNESKAVETFEKSHFAQVVRSKERKAKFTDFERFKYAQLKSKRSRMIRNALGVRKVKKVKKSVK